MNLRPVLAALALILACGRAAAVSWEPLVYPDDQIFPSYVISTATIKLPEEVFAKWEEKTLGDENGMIGILLEGAPKGADVTVEIQPNAVMGKAVFKGKIPEKSEQWLIFPRISFDFQELLRTTQPVPLNITFSVTVDGESLGEKTATVQVRPLNECLFGVQAAEGAGSTDYSWLFAAYVNENHPWIDKILHEALETGVVDNFNGYQDDDPDAVLAQIKAIWDALQKRGFKYSNTVTTDQESEIIGSQNVRLFDDVIDAHQANCVDGSVLLASILRRIGLNVYLAMLPGHMFLAVDLDAEGDRAIGIETTLMGEEGAIGDEPGKGGGWLARAADKTGGGSFASAVEAGTKQLKEYQKKFDSAKALDYQLIDISEARRIGIRPIPKSARLGFEGRGRQRQ